jgi:hypothetical protein
MPRLSRLVVRLSLVYLALGTTFGALMLANKGIPFAPLVWALLPAHIDVMFLGWMTQFALGMAFWILPRFPQEAPRGDERWSWAAFALVNSGIWFAAFSPILPFSGIVLVARLLEAAGLLAFALGNWRRVYPLKFPVVTK